MEQNQSFSIESMLKCCDVKRGGGEGGNPNDINFSARTLDKAPKFELVFINNLSHDYLSCMTLLIASFPCRLC